MTPEQVLIAAQRRVIEIAKEWGTTDQHDHRGRFECELKMACALENLEHAEVGLPEPYRFLPGGRIGSNKFQAQTEGGNDKR